MWALWIACPSDKKAGPESDDLYNADYNSPSITSYSQLKYEGSNLVILSSFWTSFVSIRSENASMLISYSSILAVEYSSSKNLNGKSVHLPDAMCRKWGERHSLFFMNFMKLQGKKRRRSKSPSPLNLKRTASCFQSCHWRGRGSTTASITKDDSLMIPKLPLKRA